MKIAKEGTYISSPIHSVKTRQSVAGSVSTTKTTNARNFDEITIRSKETFDEMSFAKELSRKIIKEASSPTEPQKLEELKMQVQSGNYSIVVDEIAKKMLLS